MIEEAAVLLRVEHFKQSAGRIAIVTSADLVHLIDKYERILSANPLKSLNNFAW
jgi:hypothetical protein